MDLLLLLLLVLVFRLMSFIGFSIAAFVTLLISWGCVYLCYTSQSPSSSTFDASDERRQKELERTGSSSSGGVFSASGYSSWNSLVKKL